MSKQLLIRCFSSSDYCPLRYALLEVTESFLEVVRKRKALVASITDEFLYDITFWAGEVSFIDESFQLEDVLKDDEQLLSAEGELDNAGYLWLPEGVTIGGDFFARTEMDQADYSRDGVMFTCYAKHTDFQSSSQEVPYGFLLGNEEGGE